MTSDTTSPPSTAFRAAGDLRLLTWPALDASGADAAVTARSGGVSSGPYATLNLSLSVGDDPGHVLENRRRLAAAFGAPPGDFVFARQVHGAGVRVVAEAARRGLDPRDLSKLFGIKPEWEREHPLPRATLAQVADHIDHVRQVAGVEHVGLGGDFDGTDEVTVGLEDVSTYPALFAELLRRGWTEPDCAALAGGNLLRALRSAESYAASAAH